jgi:hypothetical protein
VALLFGFPQSWRSEELKERGLNDEVSWIDTFAVLAPVSDSGDK